jgi:hypothetical protein
MRGRGIFDPLRESQSQIHQNSKHISPTLKSKAHDIVYSGGILGGDLYGSFYIKADNFCTGTEYLCIATSNNRNNYKQ